MKKVLSYLFVFASFFAAMPLYANDKENNLNAHKRTYSEFKNQNKIEYNKKILKKRKKQR